jgi:type IX secretion system PorP/SprF family membrane protein
MKKVLFVTLFLLSARLSAQHSALYSEYFFSGVLINPAYAGSQNALNVTSVYRNQWVGMNGAPKNFSFGAHSPLRNEKVNVGLVFSNDHFGITSRNSVSGIYAYRINFLGGKMSFGISAGLNMVKNSWSSIETTVSDDPSFVPNVERKTSPVIGSGFYFYNEKMFVGISSPELFNFNLDQFSTSMLYGGTIIKLNENLKLKPTVYFKYIKHSPLQVDLNSTLYLKNILGIGIGYRSGDAAYAYADIKINNQFNLGYSYDFTLSKIRNYSSGSHEIMIRYLFGYNIKSKSIRYF